MNFVRSADVFAGLIVVLLLVLAPAAAQTEELQKLLESAVADGLPGIALYLEVPGEGTFRLAAGEARPDSRFCIGSVSKMLVAVLVLQQVEQGRLELDQTVANLLPEAVRQGLPLEGVTVRHLLAHTSGLGDYMSDEFYEAVEADPTREWTDLEAVHFAFGDAPLAAPGGAYNYSNTGYCLLGILLETTTGKSLTRLAQEGIFTRARMTRSFFGRYRDRPADTIAGYSFESGKKSSVQGTNYGDGLADGGAISCAEDLARFLKALNGGHLLRPGTYQEMRRDAHQEKYGLGLELRATDHGTARGHAGLVDGYQADALLFPQSGVVMVLLSNCSDGDTQEVFNVLESAILDWAFSD